LKNFLFSAVLLAALVLMPACDDDPTTSPNVPSNKPAYLPLTSREAVLNNIEYAYNNRVIEVIDELLDANFIFYFAPGDAVGSIPPEWGRPDELHVTRAMFESNNQPVPVGPQIRSLHFDVQFEEGVEWTSFIPGGFPSELWYSAEVPYSFTVEVEPDFTFISKPGSTAQFTVRNAGSDEAPHYQLVECRDRGVTTSVVQALEIKPDTWGDIKALWYY
jgi:hypothetical protein